MPAPSHRDDWTLVQHGRRHHRPRDPPYIPPLNRLILAAIKATHHLANVTGPEPLPVIARLVASLMASIRPAVPNAATLALLEDSARYWAHTTSTILRDHYRATVVQKVSALSSLADPAWRPNFEVAASWAARQYRDRLRHETLDSLRSELRQELDTRAPLDALRDGSLPPSCLPPPAELLLDLRLPAPDPGTLDRDGRADRSPSRTSFVSLFSFPSYSPPPLLPPADSRPPPAAPLSQRTTRTVTKLRCRTTATPGAAQTLVQPLTTPLPTTSASGSTHAFIQPPRLIFAPPADGVTPDTPTRMPTRHTKPAPASPGTTPPRVSALTSASARRWTFAMPLQPATLVDPVCARQTFNPPADNVTLDTPTRLSIKRVSTATRSRVTSGQPADDVTPVAHTRMFCRRANTARRLSRKHRSTAPPLRDSPTEASP
ncbi:unnamed protein product [Boreogadus saida]